MAKEKIKTKRSSADKAVNAVIAVALVVVIALAAFALYDKFRPRDKVKDFAAERGMAVEDFMKEYGIEDADANTSMTDVYNNMTIENVLKLDGTTFEDAMASGQLPENVTADMTMADYEKLIEELNAALENAAASAEGEEAPAEGEAAPAEGEEAPAE